MVKVLEPVAAKPPPALPRVMPLVDKITLEVTCKVPPFREVGPDVPKLFTLLIDNVPPLIVVANAGNDVA